jgi:hypothetical protein
VSVVRQAYVIEPFSSPSHSSVSPYVTHSGLQPVSTVTRQHLGTGSDKRHPFLASGIGAALWFHSPSWSAPVLPILPSYLRNLRPSPLAKIGKLSPLEIEDRYKKTNTIFGAAALTHLRAPFFALQPEGWHRLLRCAWVGPLPTGVKTRLACHNPHFILRSSQRVGGYAKLILGQFD